MMDSTWDESWLDVGSHDGLDMRFDNPNSVRFSGSQTFDYDPTAAAGNNGAAKRRKRNDSTAHGLVYHYPDEPLHYKHSIPGYDYQRQVVYKIRSDEAKDTVLPPSPGYTSSTESESRGRQSNEGPDPEEELDTQQLIDHYLSFESCKLESCLMDEAGNTVNTSIEGHLSGNWHLTNGNKNSASENGVGGDPDSRRKQLTFYRRNLFDIRTGCSFNSQPKYVVDSHETKTMLDSLVLAIELFSSSSKRKNVTVVGRTGSPVFDRVLKLDDKEDCLDLKQEWTKVKFSSATVNNGAPNCQPYFQVVVVLRAISCTGTSVEVMRASSQPIVVRGRHPQFYQDRFGISLASADVRRKSVSAALSGTATATPSLGEEMSVQPSKSVSPPVSTNKKLSVKPAILPPSPPTPPLEDAYGGVPGSNEYYYFPLDRVSPEEMVEGFYNPHFPHQSFSIARQQPPKALSYYRTHDDEEWSYDEDTN
jgi:NDT80 / PhoG like DNA-binding  family